MAENREKGRMVVVLLYLENPSTTMDGHYAYTAAIYRVPALAMHTFFRVVGNAYLLSGGWCWVFLG